MLLRFHAPGYGGDICKRIRCLTTPPTAFISSFRLVEVIRQAFGLRPRLGSATITGFAMLSLSRRRSVSDGLAVSEIKDIAADPTCSFWGGPSAVGSDVTCKVLVGDNGITFYKSRNNATEVNPTFYTIRPSLLTLTSQQGFPS